MKLREKIEKIEKTSKLCYMTGGKSYSLDDFWDNFIELRLPKREAVEKWHEILKEYVNQIDAIFFMRAFGSKPNKGVGSDTLRRGFYNKTNYSFSAFYGDNFFTAYFYSMAVDGFAPKDCQEFDAMMRDRTFPCGYIQTRAEKNYAAYKIGRDPKIQAKGYKIAHIYSAGKDFSAAAGFSTISKFCEYAFPRNEYLEWENIETDKYGTFHCRNITFSNKEEAEKIRKFLIAHFIRTVHPLNYFLVPKEGSICWKDTDGAEHYEIGENADLIKYVACKISERYSNIYDEFLRMIYPKEIYSGCAVNKALDIQYNIDEWNEKFVKSKYSEKQRLALLKDFLFVGLSLKKLEEKHFGEAKNGWLAMSIRNSYGIENEQKGSLKKLSLDEAIATSSGELKKLLEKIKEVLT